MASDTSFPTFMHYGTNAARLAFTPVPPATGQPIYIWYATDTGLTWLYDTSWHQITSLPVTIFPSLCEGRLTTESGVPVSTADRTAQGTIYFTPTTESGVATTNGNMTLYSGSALVNVAFTQLSLALTVTSGKNYDVFVDYNAGTPQLVLSAAWTTDTARADALGTQSGILIKSGTAAYRWVGTIRASAANVTEDSRAKRFVWNAFNQVYRSLANVPETTDSWNYTLATVRQANANTANQLAYVTGAAHTLVTAEVLATRSTSNSSNAYVGIGVDSTTTNGAQIMINGNNPSGATSFLTNHAAYKGTPGLGYHFLAWLESSTASGTTTWYGDAGGTSVQSGILGTITN
jgi:hypothetical protein